MDIQPNNLKVIGSGLGRTGTLSLRRALHQLGFHPCHHGFEVMGCVSGLVEVTGNSTLKDWTKWADAAEAKALGDERKCKKILLELTRPYVSITDEPGCYFFKELAEMNPDALVVQTVRKDGETHWWW